MVASTCLYYIRIRHRMRPGYPRDECRTILVPNNCHRACLNSLFVSSGRFYVDELRKFLRFRLVMSVSIPKCLQKLIARVPHVRFPRMTIPVPQDTLPVHLLVVPILLEFVGWKGGFKILSFYRGKHPMLKINSGVINFDICWLKNTQSQTCSDIKRFSQYSCHNWR